MYTNYRNASIASFSSAESSNYDPTMSTPSLSLASGDLSSAHTNFSDFWSTSTSPPPRQDSLPVQSVQGIVNVYQYAPQQGEPKSKITVHIGFRQLPGRVIGLRIVFGGQALRTQVAHGHKRGHWQLRAEVPECPNPENPSKQALKIEALEGDNVIDFAEFGTFTYWQPGTMPASAQNQALLSRRVRSFENRPDSLSSHLSRNLAHPYRKSSITSTLAAAASAPALSSGVPMSSSPASPSPMKSLSGNTEAYRIVRRTEIPMEREAAALAVTMNIHGDVRSLSSGWTPEEVTAKRRLVQFWRHMEGSTLNVHFCTVNPEEYDDSQTVVSCVYRDDVDKCYITSFDLIRLLEGLIGTVCNIDEKNRIRRNVHHIEHDTISKSKPYHEEFFDLIMSFPAPMPRRNVRDLKAFRWEFLPDALHAIMDKMALDYNPKAVSEMIEPSIPEVAEPMDGSMPAFDMPIRSEPDRQDSAFDSDFSFSRPSMGSVLSFDTVSPNPSVTSFHQSPSTSMSNFHVSNHSPNTSTSNFHTQRHSSTYGFQSQSANMSMPSFHTHQSPNASVSSFQNHLAASSSLPPILTHGPSPNSSLSSFQLSSGGGMGDSMDLSNNGLMGFHSLQQTGTPTGSQSNLRQEYGGFNGFFGHSQPLNGMQLDQPVDPVLNLFY